MPVSRIFLDWKDPALPQAANYLRTRFTEREELALKQAIVVVPTVQAGQRLLELLVESSKIHSLRLVPPQIITLRSLPELLYVPKRPFADPLTQQFAWGEALKTLRGPDRARLMRRLPDATLLSRLAFARMLSEMHRELVANTLSFSDVAKAVSQTGDDQEISRWELLARVETAYLRLLDDLGLWDRQTARLVAIERGEFATDSDILLLGLVDLTAAHRAMLSQIADRVTALVYAPKSRASWFDEWGGLVAERWQHAPINGIFERTLVVDAPDDQALAACLALSDWNDRFAADDITIGVPDKNLAPLLEERFRECGLKVHNALGYALSHSGPARMLSAAADLIESSWFRDFANLARHPQVERWLDQQGVSANWLVELDDYYAKHFPARLDDGEASKRARRWRIASMNYPALAQAVNETDRLLFPFRRRKQPVTDWVKPIRELLLDIYGIRPLDRNQEEDRKLLAASEWIEDSLAIIEDLPESLAPKVTGAEALRLLLRELEGQLLFDPPGEKEIALLGWLDLPWDDAPALVVTGLNEGIVPTSQTPDAFLPNSLRRQMSLDDNDRRLARDAYALSALAASRKELRLIVGRRTAENDPLTPSRLLFACENRELPARVERLFSRPKPLRNRVMIVDGLTPGGEGAMFDVPKPQPLPSITTMRVTEFSAYLDCPYRYYLAHQLRLKAPETIAEELPPNAFGDMIHEVLEDFGEARDINRLTDAERIYEFLSDTLSKNTRAKFGRHPLPAVRVQIEQARLRLKGFADWQAKWAFDGWELRFAEVSIKDQRAWLDVDGEKMYLNGRIDRIDVRERGGNLEVTILDYKTGDSGASPEDKHRDKEGNWTDLQLPLYRHLIRSVEGMPSFENLELGYIVLPKRTADIGQRIAEWSGEDLEAADETAREVIRCVRRQAFWPRKSKPRYFSEFAAICQDDLFATIIQEEGEPGH